MERKYESNERALEIAKEAIWLAWNAVGGPAGSGFLRDNPAAQKEEVWKQAYEMGDYSGRGSMEKSYVNADYVFGRMLKLRFHIKGDTLQLPDNAPQRDYQGWCHKFKSYEDLFHAAEEGKVSRRIEVK